MQAQWVMGAHSAGQCWRQDFRTITGWSWDADDVRARLPALPDAQWEETLLWLEAAGLATFCFYDMPTDEAEAVAYVREWADAPDRLAYGTMDITAAGVVQLARRAGLAVPTHPAVLFAHWWCVEALKNRRHLAWRAVPPEGEDWDRDDLRW
jgi:hypothetical protein